MNTVEYDPSPRVRDMMKSCGFRCRIESGAAAEVAVAACAEGAAEVSAGFG